MTNYAIDLTGGITESFFTDLKNFAGPRLSERKRLTAVTIELFQNICRHAINTDHRKLIIQREASHYAIEAVNTVTANEVAFLQKKINYINCLNRDQLRKQRTKILSTKTSRKKSGAGLGLYYIALRSSSPLVPVFRQTDKHRFTFSLHLTLAVSS